MSERSMAAWLDGACDAPVAIDGEGRVITRARWQDDVRRAATALAGLASGTRVAIDEGEPYPFAVLLTALLWTGGEPVLFAGRGAWSEALEAVCDAVLTWRPQASHSKPVLVVSNEAEPVAPSQLTPPDAGRIIRLFTSGSSGTPKVVEKTVGLMCREAGITASLFGERVRGTVLMSTVDPRHLYGLTFGIWFALSTGTPIMTNRCVYQEQIPAGRPIALITTPTFMRMLDTTLPVPDMRFVLSAGGPLDAVAASLMTGWTGCAVHEIYGSTETGVVASRVRVSPDATPDWTLISEARLDAVGDDRLLTSPLLPTGRVALDDRLEMTGPDTFRLLGRRDRVVKIGEVRLSLTEVERVVRAELGLEIRALPVTSGTRTVIGAVVNEAESPGWIGTLPSRVAVTAALAGRLDPLARPRLWRSVAAWPCNAQGKVETQALLELFHG